MQDHNPAASPRLPAACAPTGSIGSRFHPMLWRTGPQSVAPKGAPTGTERVKHPRWSAAVALIGITFQTACSLPTDRTQDLVIGNEDSAARTVRVVSGDFVVGTWVIPPGSKSRIGGIPVSEFFVRVVVLGDQCQVTSSDEYGSIPSGNRGGVIAGVIEGGDVINAAPESLSAFLDFPPTLSPICC